MSGMSSLFLAMARLPWEMSRLAAGAVAAALPGDPGWRELDNRLRAFELFQSAGLDLGRELARMGSLDPWSGIWVAEGLGYALGMAGRPLPLDGLPERTWIPAHTGMGLALAGRAVESGEASALRAFVERCRALSWPGLAGAAIEGLGLAARTLRPDLVPGLGRVLEDLGEDLVARFWHGLGRGLFFVPTNAAPWGDPPRRALEKVWREPPHGPGRRNALAGLGWAMTLVDLRSPELLDRFLRRHATELPPDGAFSHGVAAAVLVWAQWAGRDALLEAFLSHAATDPALWDLHVRHPAERALGHLLPALRRDGRWEDLFRVRP